MADETNPGTSPPPAATAASPAAPASYVDEYDAESSGGGSAETVQTPEATPSSGPVAGTPPRDPATGRFLPAAPEGRKPSQYMKTLGEELGIPPEQIPTMTAEELDVAVYHLSRSQRARQREASVEQTIHQATDKSLGQQAGGGSPAAASSNPSNPSQPEAASPPAEEPFDLGLDESQYDPALMAAIKKMGSSHAKQIKRLEDQIAQLHRVEMVRANESFTQKMDRLFAADEQTFGKGEGHTLKEDSAELARRRAVLGVMQGIKAGSIEQKYEKAYAMLYGQRQAEPPDAELAARQEEWRRGNVARPTQRSGAAEPPGVEKATRTVASRLAEQNGAIDSGEADADDFLG